MFRNKRLPEEAHHLIDVLIKKNYTPHLPLLIDRYNNRSTTLSQFVEGCRLQILKFEHIISNNEKPMMYEVDILTLLDCFVERFDNGTMIIE